MEMEDIAEAVARMVSDPAKLRKRQDEAYEYSQRDFALWVTSEKAPRSAMKAFREFEDRFAQLSDRDQESVGADKVLLFLRSLNDGGRMAILPDLEDDKGAYGLTEDWYEVEAACYYHDEMRLSATRPASGGKTGSVSNYASPPAEEDTSPHPMEQSPGKGKAYAEAERAYNGYAGEGAEQATLSTYGERTAADKAGIHEAGITPSGVSVSSGTKLPESFYEELASILDACEIEIEEEEEETSEGAATFPTPLRETSAAGSESPSEPGDSEGGGGKAGDLDNNKSFTERSKRRRRESPTPVPETSAVAPERQHKTEEMGGGREETRLTTSIHGRRKDPTRSERKSAMRPNANTKDDRDRTEKEPNRPRWKSRHPVHHTRWEPVRAKRPSKLGKDDSVEDRARENPTPILETSATKEQREPEGMVGGGERPGIEVEADAETGIPCGTTGELKANAESRTEADASCGKADERHQGGKPESEKAATKGEKTDAEVGSMNGRHNVQHALRPAEGRVTNTHSGDPPRVTEEKEEGVTRRRDKREEPSALGKRPCKEKRIPKSILAPGWRLRPSAADPT